MKKNNDRISNTITPMDIDIQRQKALKVLELAKDLEKRKIGYKFVKIDERTRIFRKV